MIVSFFCPGIAKPQGSKRAFRTRANRIVLVESSRDVGWWRETVRLKAGEAMREAACVGWHRREPLTMDCWFYMPKPLSAAKSVRFPVTTPDLDKLLRAIGDACAGVVFRNDSQIVDMVGHKRFATDERSPGVLVQFTGA